MPASRAWPLFRAPLFVGLGLLAACDGDAAGSLDTGPGTPVPQVDPLQGAPPAFATMAGYSAPPQLSYRILAGRGNGGAVSGAALLSALQTAEAICLGETHDSFAVHSMQLLLLDRLRGDPASASQRAVGMEMFQRPFQAPLTQFSEGQIDEGALRTLTEYDTRWGWDWDFYRPLVLHAVSQGHPLLALNAARELTRRVSMVGVQGLTDAERAQLPELDFSDEAHLAWFADQISAGHGDLSPERLMQSYATQVIWDETMADTAASWLKGTAGRRIVILAGRGHCVDGAIPARMRRRGIGQVLGLQILDDTPGAVQAAVLGDAADYVIGVGAP